MKYLIMKCEELMDQFECDANRWPETMTNDWKKWYKEIKPNFLFEVYEYKNNEFKCIKKYDSALEEGMIFVWYDDNTPEGEFNIIKRFSGYSRHYPMPKDLYVRASNNEDFDDSLENCGYVSWTEGNKYYAYTEYEENRIYPPY